MALKQIHCFPIFSVVLVSTALTFFQLRVTIPSPGSEGAWYDYNDFSKEHVEANNAEISCELLPDDDLPMPVILMARGRSGSSITWDTISELMGQRNVARELTGGNRNSSLAFFDNLAHDPQKGHDWALHHLCLLQQHRPELANSTIVGFQWKPFTSSFDHEYAVEGLRSIAAQQNPHVRVIYLTRNPIDKKISNLRHKQAKTKTSTKISAHCAVDDEECIQEHLKFEENITFPLGPELFDWLYASSESDSMIKKRLHNFGVQHIHITYENLFHTESADEWVRLLKFLGREPSINMTMNTVRSTFSMAPTHKKSQKETIKNYDALKKSINGTEWQTLLD